MLVLQQRSASAAELPPPVMRGYVPLEAKATQDTMENVSELAGTTLNFTVGITNAAAGAVIYYDHHEDGFEVDPTAPAKATTKIWGDGDASNGDAAAMCGPTCAGDALPAGAVFVLRNFIDTTRLGAINPLPFDGGDRVSSTRGFAISAAGFTELGAVLSASASAYDTTKWGQDYWIPVGEDMEPPANTSDAFSTTSVQVMADQPDTVVTIDKNRDGTIDPATETKTIGPGQVFHVDEGVERGARVLSTKPVQVHVGAGDDESSASGYELRWFTLFPTNLLSSDYLNPVGSSNGNQRTITYLFNPNSAAITVTPTCGDGCDSPITIPAKGGDRYPSPEGKSVRFTSGSPFVAVGAVGSESGASPGTRGDNSKTFDWGFSLVPTNLLTTKALLGLAPGNSKTEPKTGDLDDYNDDPVWISALGDTDLYIDYDGNPTTGTHNLPAGCGTGKYDVLQEANEFESVRLYDRPPGAPGTADGTMTGARIFTCDGTKIAGAWGEDPEEADPVDPGWDAGYTLIPSTAMLLEKTAGLAQDANGDGRFGPDDVIAYEVAIANAGAIPFTNLKVTDAVPPGTTYVPGSTTFTTVGPAGPIADDTGQATPFPFDEDGMIAPPIPEGATGRISYNVKINNPFPSAAGSSIDNLVKVDGPEEDGEDKVTIPLVSADLSLDKVLVEPGPTYLGQNAMFRVVVRNDGPDTAEDVVVSDALPAGLEFVSATPNEGGTYDQLTGLWTVGDVPNNATRTLEVVARVNVLDTKNVAEIVSARVHDRDSTPGNGPTTVEDDEDEVPVRVQNLADVELTKELTSGPDAAGRSTFTLTLANTGPGRSSGVKVTEYPPPSASFISATPVTSETLDGTFNGSTNQWTLPDLDPGRQARIKVVYSTPVAPEFNLVQVTESAVHDPDSNPDTVPLTPVTDDQDDEDKAQIPAIGDVELSNVVTQPPQYVGDTVEFTVRVTNTGPTNTTNVSVVDQLPEGLLFLTATASTGTYNPSSGVWNVGDMPSSGPGSTQTLVITARVLKPGTITTMAEVTSSTATDKDSTPGNNVEAEDDQEPAPVSTTGATLGDTVWFDTDLDYVKDDGELGLTGVKVTAIWAGPNGTIGDADDEAFETTTGPGGTWSLTGLPKGEYRVAVDPATLPEGISKASQDRDGQNSANVTTLTLQGGETITDVDFAYVGAGRIGDAVFLDTNGNGEADPTEGIPGVTVKLTWNGPDGNPGTPDDVEYTRVTDPEGRYDFPNLPAGKFRVEVVTGGLPEGVRNAVDPQGDKDNQASFELTTGQERLDLDFGYVGTNTIGDRVFTDINGDGVQQPGEPGLGGVTVTLERDLDGDGTYETTADSAATAGNGDYRFEELPAGRYRVVISTPDGLELTTPENVTKAVSTGETFLDADFGLKPPAPPAPAKIGDLVWDDRNGNALPDPDEPGIPGAKVTLWETGGPAGEKDRVVATQTTGPDGTYSFENLPPGSYRVTVTPPDGYTPTTPVGIPVPLSPGTSIDTADFGLTKGTVPPGVIGDRVWADLNSDGIQDPGENGLPNVELKLLRDKDGDGVYETEVGTTKTDPNGAYSFKDVPPGAYRVVVTPPADNSPTVPTVATVDLKPGQTVDTADFGFTPEGVPPSSIGDRIWLDSNRDGKQDPDEPGVNDVTVTLRSDPDGDGIFDKVVSTRKTSGDGNYEFGDLPPGLYLVTVTPPDGLAPTVPPVVVPLVAGQSVVTADLGLATPPQVPFDLQVIKQAETTPLDGDDMTWHFTVINNGIKPSPAELTVTDTLPAGLAYRSASGSGWSCTASGRTVTCKGAGPLARGASSTFRVVTGVSLAAGKEVLNGALVEAPGIELTKENNRSQAGVVVGTPPPPLVLPATTEPAPTLTPAAPAPPPGVDVLSAGEGPAPSASLPVTGSDIGFWLRLAVVLAVAGLGVIVATRRRTTER